jgi:hypothetical protein
MTRDFPMVACSVLFKTALRGAATGVGSLARLGVVFVFVLITGFSGSVASFGFGLGVVLAGFHIVFTSFQLLVVGNAASYFAPLLCNLSINWDNHELRWHVHYQTRHLFPMLQTLDLALPYAVTRPRCGASVLHYQCNYSSFPGISYIGQAP